MLGISYENDFGTEGTDMGGLPDDALVVEDRLALEDAIRTAAVDEKPLAQAARLDDEFGGKPALGDGR